MSTTTHQGRYQSLFAATHLSKALCSPASGCNHACLCTYSSCLQPLLCAKGLIGDWCFSPTQTSTKLGQPVARTQTYLLCPHLEIKFDECHKDLMTQEEERNCTCLAPLNYIESMLLHLALLCTSSCSGCPCRFNQHAPPHASKSLHLHQNGEYAACILFVAGNQVGKCGYKHGYIDLLKHRQSRSRNAPHPSIASLGVFTCPADK